MRTHNSLRTILLGVVLSGSAIAAGAAGLQECPAGSDSSGSSEKTCVQAGCTFLGGTVATAPSLNSGQPDPQNNADETTMTFKKVFLNLPGDQKAIWTSPFRLRLDDSVWLAPLAGTTGLLIGSDRHSMERERSNALAVSRSDKVSNGGLAGMAALPAFMYAWGSLRGQPRVRETGLLSGEALLNTYAVNEALKLAFQRERPTSTDGQGRFFSQLGGSSFPSGHSMLSWTVASVIAHEYPGALSQTLVYGAATAVSISRVTGRQHFPSDVVVGRAD